MKAGFFIRKTNSIKFVTIMKLNIIVGIISTNLIIYKVQEVKGKKLSCFYIFYALKPRKRKKRFF